MSEPGQQSEWHVVLRERDDRISELLAALERVTRERDDVQSLCDSRTKLAHEAVRQRDEAVEALRPFLISGSYMESVDTVRMMIGVEHLRRAAAIVAKGKG